MAAPFLSTITALSATAQSWTNLYSGSATNGWDQAYAVAVGGNGNVYVTGRSAGINSDNDYATLAYTSQGMPLWTNRYNGPGNADDGARAIAVDASGNVYITGTSMGSDSSWDYAMVAYTANGMLLWTQRYNGPGNDFDQAFAIAVDSSGNVYVTGESQNTGPFNEDYRDYATIKYSSTGVPLWTRRYDGPQHFWDWAVDIAAHDNGNVYVTGTSLDGSTLDAASSDITTIAYSSAGVPLWTRHYNGPDNGSAGANAIAVDGSGNVYVLGASAGSDSGLDYVTIKYSSAGVVLWTRRYNGPGNGDDHSTAITVASNGNVYVTGYSRGSDSSWDGATIAYTSDGVALWTNRYTGAFAGAIALDGSDYVYVAGGGGSSDGDCLTIAYTTGGVPLWTRRYNGPGNLADTAYDIAVDASGNVYVTGVSTGSDSYSEYVTIKYVPPLADHFTCSLIPSPQAVDAPFPVTLTARSLSETNCTFYTNTAILSGYAPGRSATNIIIGTGTSSWAYPLYTRYHDARTQVIYRNWELGMACTINSLGLDVTTAPGQTLENWNIRMKHTTLHQYPSTPEWDDSGWTVVYQANEPEGTTGWRTFELSTPFEYNGSNNLLVDFSFNNDSYSSEGQCQSTVMGAYRSITFASDSKDGDPLTWFSTNPIPVRSYNVPNVLLGTTYPDLLPVSISPTVTTPFVNGVWTGDVTVHEAVTDVVLEAHSADGVGGESNPFDVLAPQAPVIVTDDGQLGITNGHFGFNVQGQAGQVVVIEVSTNLVDWMPLQTNILSGAPWYFSDPDITLFTKRFYRAVTP